LFATLYPIAPGTATCTIASVSLPIAFSSAISSNGFNLSKKFSTSAARLVSAPKSINSAPNENTPSGIFNNPDAIPDAAAVYHAVSLFRSADC
jgi:hypothetical protein